MPDRRRESGGAETDALRRFLIETAGVRGALVRLDRSWTAVLDRHPYPAPVRGPLGEALAAVTLLSSTIKFEGSLILQVESGGPIRTLVVQATDRRTLRGLARWEGEVPDSTALADLFGEGRVVLTATAPGGERYQGVVPLEGAILGDALERYFEQSEQLPTRVWLAAGPQRAAGLLLQAVPGGDPSGEGWARATALAATLSSAELLGLPTETLLHRLFHEERVRLFDAETVAFRCGCSRERIEGLLRSLGRDEVESIVAEQGAVEITCEFCNRRYRLDAVDAAMLFSGTAGGSDTRH
jgi:molecular chaperone Hsp33